MGLSIRSGFCTLGGALDTLPPKRPPAGPATRLSLVPLVLLAVLLLGGAGEARSQETTTQVPQGNPEETVAPPPPEIAANAWALADLRTGEDLAGEDEDRRLPMASTTKVMTGL